MTDAPTEREDDGTWTRLTRRKVVQWGIAYVAGAWGLLQGLQYVSGLLNWPPQLQKLAGLALLIGLPLVLVIAWYHGDKGHQRVTRTELVILTLLFLFGGALFWRYQHASQSSSSTSSAIASVTGSAGTTGAGPSIAVLPFENRSAKSDDAFFVDGIHDDILTQLSKISALKVISRTSVERFRDTKLPMKDIATQLGVTKILEGGVQRAGDRVRITVQLIDAGTDAHLWAETYDRELTAVDIFAIQSEVAVAIADALKAELTQGEKARVDAVPTRNLEAWEAYQLGRQRLARRTTGALVEAEKFFAKAIELDPRFALAYTGLADSLTLRTDTGDTPYVAALEQAQVAVNAALKLDPALSEAWASAGLIAAQQSRTDRAEQMYRRAIELNPNNATALKWYGQTLVNTLRIDEGLRALEKAADLDPLSVIIQWNLSDALQAQGRFAEAATHDRRAIEIDPSTPGPYAHLAGLTGYALNRFAVAVPLAQKAVELDSGTAIWAALLSGLHLDIGDDDELLAKSKQTAGGLPDNWRMQLHLAFVDLYRQDPTGAVRNAEQSLARFPRNQGALSMLRNADLQSGHEVDAFARYQKAYPELFAPSVPRLDASNYGVAVDLALVLQKRGDAARASILLDAAAQAIAKVPRMGGEYGYGITDVQIHALRSDKAKALTALREAEKAGWRGPYWRYFRDFDPNLASIRDEPEFKAVFADIERDMARQRAELAKRPKDAPLALE